MEAFAVCEVSSGWRLRGSTRLFGDLREPLALHFGALMSRTSQFSRALSVHHGVSPAVFRSQPTLMGEPSA